jgi:hypothetical protein
MLADLEASFFAHGFSRWLLYATAKLGRGAALKDCNQFMVRFARRPVCRGNDVRMLVTAIGARPDWLVTAKTEHFTEDMVAVQRKVSKR